MDKTMQDTEAYLLFFLDKEYDYIIIAMFLSPDEFGMNWLDLAKFGTEELVGHSTESKNSNVSPELAFVKVIIMPLGQLQSSP